ncbi:MAG: Cytochrome c1 [Alphaproteobacteria bacterium MarineAlpha9_Bin2]|nr:MAG: Cytochrome c1 [Alphaproteobacteria bacterium MarineAlpha9_Bin2]
MFSKFFIRFLFYIFSIYFLYISLSFSAGKSFELYDIKFSFDGIFGTFDKPSARRGLQIYREVCSGCHGLKFIAYRNLTSLGYSREEIKNMASEYEIEDGPNSEGEMYLRPAVSSDNFIDPYANINMAKFMNNGAAPPDLSLIVKARNYGSKYVYSLLMGYKDIPDNFDSLNGYYNKFYPGHIIAMPQPLYGDDVEYLDGTISSLEQEVIDITTFLTWTSHPEMVDRKKMGFKVLVFLIFMTGLLFLSYKKIWKPVKDGSI